MLIKIVMAIVLYNLFVEILEELLSWVLTKMNVVMPGGAGQTFDIGTVSSLAAWAVTRTRLLECVSFMMGIIVLRFVLRKIPFIRW